MTHLSSQPLWRAIQKNNFRDPALLAQFLELPEDAVHGSTSFPLNLPQRIAHKIEKGNRQDPLFLQFVSPLQSQENASHPGFVLHPVEDQSFCRSSKLLQKYRERALLLTTSACAMHCRYCFRQHFPYEKERGFDRELDVIREDSSLKEIILSGGDPLSLSDATLGSLFEKLSQIDHVKIVRIHTRFIVGIPERIDDLFFSLLEKIHSKQLVFVIHFNHPRELDAEIISVLKRLHKQGIILLSQTVLLHKVNDQVSILKELCEKLIHIGVIPYYLHHLDRVAGAEHFEVSIDKGRACIEELRSCLPGYALFRYVAEIPYALSKTPL